MIAADGGAAYAVGQAIGDCLCGLIPLGLLALLTFAAVQVGRFLSSQGRKLTAQQVYQGYTEVHQEAVAAASQAAAHYMSTGPVPETLNGRVVLGAPIYTELYEMQRPEAHQAVIRRERTLAIIQAVVDALPKR